MDPGNNPAKLGLGTARPAAKRVRLVWHRDFQPSLTEALSTAELAQRYPHLADKTGPNCSGAVKRPIWNRS